MRVVSIVISLLLTMVPVIADEKPDGQDPYSIPLVSAELKMNAEGRRVIHSWSQKRLVQLGDRVSVTILKILEPAELKDPQKVKSCLIVIRQAFAQPQMISVDADKDPRVTLFLLDYWKSQIADPEAQREIQSTLAFVKEKTAK